MNNEIVRAIEMLGVAAKFAANNSTSIVFYDGAYCDGYCLASDCEDAIAGLIDALGFDPKAIATPTNPA